MRNDAIRRTRRCQLVALERQSVSGERVAETIGIDRIRRHETDGKLSGDGMQFLVIGR